MDLVQIQETIKGIAVLSSVLMLSYGGFILMTSNNPNTRNEWKEIMTGVFLGISVLFLAPIIAQTISGGNYCA